MCPPATVIGHSQFCQVLRAMVPLLINEINITEQAIILPIQLSYRLAGSHSIIGVCQQLADLPATW